MTIKKSLLAVATASTVAIAGAGVANAQDGLPGKDIESAGSSVSSLNDAQLSDQAGAIFGSTVPGGEDGKTPVFDIRQAVIALGATAATGAAVGGSIMVLPNIYEATKAFQAYVDQFTGDTQAFINSFTN